MANIQLEDLVYTYPDINTQGFQTLISAKQEFRELASAPTEATPERGQLYKHQLLIRRYMAVYDRILLIHQTGTGKSCAAFGSSEPFKLGMIGATIDFVNIYLKPQRTHIKRIYVLTRNSTLIDELKYQLACRCTSGDYLTDLVTRADKEPHRKRNLTLEIQKYYTMSTYKKFALDLESQGYTDDQLRELYSGSFFIVDEVQNVNMDPFTGPETEQRRIYAQLHRLFHVIERSKVMLLSATPMINSVNEIAPVMNLILPLGQNPDMPFGDNQLPLTRNIDGRLVPFDYSNVTLDDMKPYFQARVSFVRALDTGVTPTYVGQTLPVEYNVHGLTIRSQSVVDSCTMSEFQANTYEQASEDNSAFRTVERQAANFVFPNEKVGKEGFDTYVEQVTHATTRRDGSAGREREPDRYRAIGDFGRYISGNVVDGQYVASETFRQLSCKFASIVESSTNDAGSVFIYTDFVVGGGAALLGLCFEAAGFEQFYESSSVFTAIASNRLQSLCQAGPGEDDDRRTIRIDKRPRFALLTGETKGARLSTLLATFNSPENRHGEYIKVLIGSPEAKIGLNLSNVVQIHLVGPAWNQANMYQALSRAIRSTSHVALLREAQAAALVAGTDPALARVPINVYQHAAAVPNTYLLLEGQIYDDIEFDPATGAITNVFKDDGTEIRGLRANREGEVFSARGTPVTGSKLVLAGTSVDTSLYALAERKDIYIKRMERIMKQVAIDCQIHKARNVRLPDPFNPERGDREGSAACDYQSCNFECADPAPTEVDYSSYDVLYAGEIIDEARSLILLVFHNTFTLNINALYYLPPMLAYRPKYILQAVEKIISQKQPLIDRYGRMSYLREDGDMLFLQREYPLSTIATRTSQSLSYYAETLVGQDSMKLPDYINTLQTGQQGTAVEALYTQEPGSEAFNAILDSLSLEVKVKLLEAAVSDQLTAATESPTTSVNDAFNNAIISRFEAYIFMLPEPVAEIDAVKMKEEQRSHTRGRKPKPEAKHRIPKINPLRPVPIISPVDGGAETVYIHKLYSTSYGNVSYAVTSKFNKGEGRLRLLKPSEMTGWRDVLDYEYGVYNALIQARTNEIMAEYEKYPVYGTIMTDKKFRIRDKTTEDPEKIARDARNINRGKVCNTWKMPELVRVLWVLGLTPDKSVPTDGLSRERMLRYLTDKGANTTEFPLVDMADDQLLVYYQWYYLNKYSRGDICTLLQKHLAETGRLFVA